jgi:hypothetical protein
MITSKWLVLIRPSPAGFIRPLTAESRMVVGRFHRVLLRVRSTRLPKSLLGTAISYALGQWAHARIGHDPLACPASGVSRRTFDATCLKKPMKQPIPDLISETLTFCYELGHRPSRVKSSKQLVGTFGQFIAAPLAQRPTYLGELLGAAQCSYRRAVGKPVN